MDACRSRTCWRWVILGLHKFIFTRVLRELPDVRIVDVPEHAPVTPWLVTSAASRTDMRI